MTLLTFHAFMVGMKYAKKRLNRRDSVFLELI